MKDQLLHVGAQFELAEFGELISEPSRVAMLLALMDGSMRPASELADIAGVTRSTASTHLARLLAGGLLTVECIGRHRYHKLASEQVADALEALSLLRPPPAARVALSPARQALAEARTCYLHLAGRLGVAWLGALERANHVALRADGVVVTPSGGRALEELGIAPSDAAAWPHGKLCLDWTERHYHLGGPLGSLLTDALFRLKWIARRSDSRAVRVTTRGERKLAETYALSW